MLLPGEPSSIALAYAGEMRLRNRVRTVEGDRGPGGVTKALETLCNRWKRGVFAQMPVGLAADQGEEKTVMIPSH